MIENCALFGRLLCSTAGRGGGVGEKTLLPAAFFLKGRLVNKEVALIPHLYVSNYHLLMNPFGARVIPGDSYHCSDNIIACLEEGGKVVDHRSPIAVVSLSAIKVQEIYLHFLKFQEREREFDLTNSFLGGDSLSISTVSTGYISALVDKWSIPPEEREIVENETDRFLSKIYVELNFLKFPSTGLHRHMGRI